MSVDPTRPCSIKNLDQKCPKCEPNGKPNSHNRNPHDFSIWNLQKFQTIVFSKKKTPQTHTSKTKNTQKKKLQTIGDHNHPTRVFGFPPNGVLGLLWVHAGLGVLAGNLCAGQRMLAGTRSVGRSPEISLDFRGL